jgi:hypothetical protein
MVSHRVSAGDEVAQFWAQFLDKLRVEAARRQIGATVEHWRTVAMRLGKRPGAS